MADLATQGAVSDELLHDLGELIAAPIQAN